MLGIDWRESMSVGVEEIDKQHQQLVDTIQELNQAIIEHDIENNLVETFERLFGYMTTHFATEEGYFDKFNFAEAAEHKAAHLFFKKRVLEMHENINKNVHELSLELVAFLEFWLVGHVMVMDQRYVQCFHEHGLK
jgi:hemerythrin